MFFKIQNRVHLTWNDPKRNYVATLPNVNIIYHSCNSLKFHIRCPLATLVTIYISKHSTLVTITAH